VGDLLGHRSETAVELRHPLTRIGGQLGELIEQLAAFPPGHPVHAHDDRSAKTSVTNSRALYNAVL
jgi:hypothetical protein